MEKNVILFDLDGTVIDSKQGIFNALYYTFDKLGMPRGEKLDRFIGPSIGASFMKIYGFNVEQAHNAVAIYREYYSTKGILECSLYDGIIELVLALKKDGKRVGIATKKPAEFTLSILKNLKVDQHFDAICGSDLSETHDSKAHIIKKGALLLSQKIDLSDVVMVGDTKYDIIGSNDAGVNSIGILYGYGTREELTEHGATWICENMEQLSRLLLNK